MTVQPLAPPANDLELIEHLDHDPEVPCAAKRPFHAGDDPARYGIRETCCNDGSVKPICVPCWDRMGAFPLWECNTCGRRVVGRDNAFDIVTVIGRPS